MNRNGIWYMKSWIYENNVEFCLYGATTFMQIYEINNEAKIGLNFQIMLLEIILILVLKHFRQI